MNMFYYNTVTALFLLSHLVVMSQSRGSESCCSSIDFGSFSCVIILSFQSDEGILYHIAYKNGHALCWPWNCTRNCCWSLSGPGMLVGEDMENCSGSNIVSFLCVLRSLRAMHEEGLCQYNCQFVMLLNNLHKYCSKHRNSKGYTVCPPSSKTEVNESSVLAMNLYRQFTSS